MIFNNNGAILTTAPDALAVAQAVFVSTFGANVNLDPSSPNGQTIQELADIINASDNNVAYLLNSLNPNLANGIALDAICANLYLYRKQASYSEVTCQVTGLPNVIIPAGSQVQSTNQDIFIAESNITIGSNGQGSGVFIAQVAGNLVPVAVNSITTILTGENGWDTVNNSTAGNVGTDLETDAALRARFNIAKANASTASYLAVQSAISSLSDVQSFILIENDTSSPVTKFSVTIPANTLYLIVSGGTPLEIADAFYNNKSAGCGTTGATSFAYPIPNTQPQQTQTIFWDVPVQQQLTINVTLVKNGNYSPTIQSDIATAINENWSYSNLGLPVYATQFVNILENAGISPIVSLTLTCSTFTAVSVLLLPINQTIATPLTSANINIAYQ